MQETNIKNNITEGIIIFQAILTSAFGLFDFFIIQTK